MNLGGSSKIVMDDCHKSQSLDSLPAKDGGLPIAITDHDKLPDIVLHDVKRNWLFLIEPVTSHGPMSPKRIVELEQMLLRCKARKIFVSVFPDFTEFRKR